MSARSVALVRDTFVYGVGEAATRALAFLTLPIYARALSPAEFGEYSYIGTFVGLASALLVLGGDTAYARYFFANDSVEYRRVLTTTWIGFLGAWSLIATAVALAFAPALSEWSFGTAAAAQLFIVANMAVPISIVNRMCGQVLRNQFRPWAYSAMYLGFGFLSIAFAIVAVVVLRLGVFGILLGLLVGEVAQLPFRIWSVRGMLGRNVSRELLRHLLAFGVPLVPTSVAYWVFLTSDRIVLGQVSGLDQLGIYAVAGTLVAVGATAISALGQAWTPHVMAAYEEDDVGARRLVSNVATYLLAAFGFLAVALTTFSHEFFGILTTSSYASAALLVPPLGLAMVAQASMTVTSLGITLRKRTAFLALLAGVAAIVNLVLNLLLDPEFGAAGAAWATTATYVALTAGYLGVSQRLWPVDYDWRKLSLLTVIIVGFTLVAGLLPPATSWPDLAARVGIILSYSLAVIGLRAIDVRKLVLAISRRSRTSRTAANSDEYVDHG
jgi:O-antigen/teichoic acid export membrane protein